jgi:signal transduction histidine kinase
MKHSQASPGQAAVMSDAESVCLEVSDDRIGFRSGIVAPGQLG